MITTTGWDVSGYDSTYPPGVPFALTGYVITRCSGQNTGTYTGQIFATYPGVTPPPVCKITKGTYSIDPYRGALTSSATIADVTPGSCAAFGNKSISESGFLLDPSGTQLYQVETGQGGGDTLPFIWTKQK